MKVLDRASVLALLVALLSLIAIILLMAESRRDLSTLDKKRDQVFSLHGKAAIEVEGRAYMRANLPSFDSVMASIGQGTTQRRRWVEVLAAAKENLSLPELQFDIYPVIQVNKESSDYAINIGHEAIELTLGLLHEGELLKLFDYLKQNVNSPFEIVSLDVERLNSKGEGFTDEYTEVNLKVNCTIRWHSIGLVGADVDQV